MSLPPQGETNDVMFLPPKPYTESQFWRGVVRRHDMQSCPTFGWVHARSLVMSQNNELGQPRCAQSASYWVGRHPHHRRHNTSVLASVRARGLAPSAATRCKNALQLGRVFTNHAWSLPLHYIRCRPRFHDRAECMKTLNENHFPLFEVAQP